MSCDTIRPVAVYGTLREGGGNARLWSGLARAEPGVLHGFRLVGHGRAFPFALPEPGALTVVDLIRWDDAAAELVGLPLMDRLEGVPHFYCRVAARVTDAWGDDHLAWVYTPAHPERYANLPAVPNNDWMMEAIA